MACVSWEDGHPPVIWLFQSQGTNPTGNTVVMGIQIPGTNNTVTLICGCGMSWGTLLLCCFVLPTIAPEDLYRMPPVPPPNPEFSHNVCLSLRGKKNVSVVPVLRFADNMLSWQTQRVRGGKLWEVNRRQPASIALFLCL